MGVKFARIQYDEVISMKKKDLHNTFEQILESWTRGNIGPILGNITEFSKANFQKRAAAILAEGLENNWSRKKISRNLRTSIRELNKHRARTIARTEVGKAQSVGHLKGIEATGMRYVKIWKTNIDGRERDDHREANGQTVEKGEPFIVGGERLDMPKIGGSAKQVINCRCTAKFEVVEEEEPVLAETL